MVAERIGERVGLVESGGAAMSEEVWECYLSYEKRLIEAGFVSTNAPNHVAVAAALLCLTEALRAIPDKPR